MDNFNASWLWSICETMTSCLWHLHEGQRCHTHQLRHLITGGTSDEQFWLWWHKYSPEILYSVNEKVSKKPRWGLQQDCFIVQLKLMVCKSRLHLRNLPQAYCNGVLGQRFLYIRRDNGGVTVGRAVSQMKRFLTKSSTLSPRKQPGPVSSSALVESSNSRVF